MSSIKASTFLDVHHILGETYQRLRQICNSDCEPLSVSRYLIGSLVDVLLPMIDEVPTLSGSPPGDRCNDQVCESTVVASCLKDSIVEHFLQLHVAVILLHST